MRSMYTEKSLDPRPVDATESFTEISAQIPSTLGNILAGQSSMSDQYQGSFHDVVFATYHGAKTAGSAKSVGYPVLFQVGWRHVFSPLVCRPEKRDFSHRRLMYKVKSHQYQVTSFFD
jgi:hypothetical protein